MWCTSCRRASQQIDRIISCKANHPDLMSAKPLYPYSQYNHRRRLLQFRVLTERHSPFINGICVGGFRTKLSFAPFRSQRDPPHREAPDRAHRVWIQSNCTDCSGGAGISSNVDVRVFCKAVENVFKKTTDRSVEVLRNSRCFCVRERLSYPYTDTLRCK